MSGGPQAALEFGLQTQGYRFLPPSGFDAAGNLRLPQDFELPASWSETVGKVTASPDWTDLLQILGPLATPGSDWYCWRVAVGFHDGTLRVLVARPGSMAGGSQVAANWAGNFWDLVGRLKQYAGRKHLLPVGLTDAVKAVAGDVKDSPYWDRQVPKKQQKDFQALKWRVSTGLDLIAKAAELLASITVRSKVQATVLWYDPNDGAVPTNKVQWAPLHQFYGVLGQRTVHYWWNYAWDTTQPQAYPFVYNSAALRSSFLVCGVAHQPWELAGTLYPNGHWAPPAPAPAPARHRVCEDIDGKMRCWWEPGTYLAAEEPAPASEGVSFGGAEVPFAGPALDSLEVPAVAAEVTLEAGGSQPPSVAASEPSILAYGLEGGRLGEGSVRDGIWYPRPEDEEAIPDCIALPALGLVAWADAASGGWRPEVELPQVPAPPAEAKAAA
jgi:hypothetical protein